MEDMDRNSGFLVPVQPIKHVLSLMKGAEVRRQVVLRSGETTDH